MTMPIGSAGCRAPEVFGEAEKCGSPGHPDYVAFRLETPKGKRNRSAFGDLNQHGPDSVRFYTRTKTVTSRWPSGMKEGAEFVIPTMN